MKRRSSICATFILFARNCDHIVSKLYFSRAYQFYASAHWPLSDGRRRRAVGERRRNLGAEGREEQTAPHLVPLVDGPCGGRLADAAIDRQVSVVWGSVDRPVLSSHTHCKLL